MSRNNSIYEVEEPSNTFLRPDSLIGNNDGFLRGLMETPGRVPTSSYNKLVNILILCSYYTYLYIVYKFIIKVND